MDAPVITVVDWNINRSDQALRELLSMDADLALLQEVHPSGWRWLADLGDPVEVTPHEPWLPWGRRSYDRWPLVVKLSDRVRLEWFEPRNPIHWPHAEQLPVSGIGTIAAARVTPASGQEPFIAASMYGRWREPHPTVGDRAWIHSDASAHRIISDLSVFISPREGSTHRILAAGDLNLGFLGRFQSDGRMQSVLTRMQALGMEYIGPQTPDAQTVPTYHTGSEDQTSASTQLDHVFASQGFHGGVHVTAMNGADEWGPSDHCRLVVHISDG